MRYRADIDGLRAIAVLAVLCYHAGLPGASGGFVGVDVFLVISGYLIATLLAEEEAAHGRIDLLSFWGRRIRRLLPLTLAVALAVLPAGWFLLLPHHLKDYGQSLAVAPFFGANLLFWQEAGYFTARAADKPLLHLWSLALEGQFYLFLPLAWAALRGPGGGRRQALAFAAAASFALSLRASQVAPESAYFLLPFRLWEFLVGALLAARGARAAGAGPGLAGLALILLAVAFIDASMAFPGLAASLPVAGAALLIAYPLRGLGVAPLALLGRLSFGLYLWHFPLFLVIGQIWPERPLWPMLPVLLPALTALSWASWRWIEQPFRKPRRARLALPAAAATAVAAGLALHLSGGAPDRLSAEALSPLSHAERWAMPCHDKLTLKDLRAGRVCRIGAEGVAPSVALLGDSHAGHLTPALGPALAARGRAGLVFSRGWCPPLPGFGTTAPGRGPECAAFMAEAWSRLDRMPGIETVILSAQWANFTEGRRGGMAPVRYGGARHPRENAAGFAKALASLAPRLSGRRVVVIGPVPEYPRPVPDMLARAAWPGGPGGAAPEPVPYGARNAAALAALAAFAERTGASFLDARAVFCAAGCRVTDSRGVPLYRDEAHLSATGARLLVDRLMPHLDPGLSAGLR